jgi:3D (Asp-Asp-Asp) domain-containing protein
MVATLLRPACFLGALLAAGLGQSPEYGATPSDPHLSVDTLVSTDLTKLLAGDFVQEYDSPFYRINRVTAYCDRGVTASGVPAGVGQCAAPADIPFGSKIYIPALDRTFIVTDRTAKRFRNGTVDLFMPDRQQCLEFGRSYLECEISTPAQTPKYGSPRIAHAVAALES